MKERTNWDRYYQNTPSYTSVTRSISSRKIVGLIKRLCGKDAIRICELGGANSCFVEAIDSAIPVSSYHVIDFNEFGLRLLDRKRPRAKLTWEHGDVLSHYEGVGEYDLVYSVGLIEHFDPAETRRAIEYHFARCKPGGVVLITFPTPTLPYKLIRRAAELTGKWAFPDERPLEFDEVIAGCQGHGTVIHQSINWIIGLTQGYLAVRKAS